MEKVVIISGSPWNGTRLQGMVDYVEKLLRNKNFQVDIVNVADLPAEDLMFANFKSEAIMKATKLVEEAEGVIVASPVYKASFTGVLKTFLDLLPQYGLEDKITLPLMVGGTKLHLLAIDYSLKPVLSALGTETLIKGVYAINESITREEDGTFTLDQEIAERLEKSVRKLSSAMKQQALE